MKKPKFKVEDDPDVLEFERKLKVGEIKLDFSGVPSLDDVKRAIEKAMRDNDPSTKL